MRIPGYGRLAPILVGAALAAAIAGCGGSSSASEVTLQAPTARSAQQRAVLRTPQDAVRSYIEGAHGLDGAALCNVLSEGLRRVMVSSVTHAGAEGVSCPQALGLIARAIANPHEHHLRLPRFHVRRTGDSAVVTYIGTSSHHLHTFVLVKHKPGWLIEKINGNG